MPNLQTVFRPALLTFCLCFLSIIGIQTSQAAAVPSLVVGPVDDSDTVVLAGNTLPPAMRQSDLGLADSSLQLGHMNIVLQRSAAQEEALASFNERQYDRSSSDYHHWLRADEFGETYGPSAGDIAAVTQWLEGQGFYVYQVSKGKVSIEFSGSVAQVQKAFQVELHRYEIGGVQHVANDRDPRIPRALAPVVKGVASLNDFRPVSAMIQGGYVKRDRHTGKLTRVFEETVPGGGGAHPAYASKDSLGPIEDLAPYDFAAIYNLLPLWKEATPILGTGVTVAIAGQSDVTLSDIANYRSSFGLPAKVPTVIHNGTDPGLVGGDQGEQTLDLEMASAAAPGANLTLVVTEASANGAFGSAQYIIDHETAPILSMSYQQCELTEGTAGNAQINTLWQQGATEGISIFVATGDFGSALCTQGRQSAPTEDKVGTQVNGLASSPYLTAVGGTDFVWNWIKNGAADFWTTNAADGASAKGYVGEMVWNTSCANTLLQEFSFTSGGSPLYKNSEALCTGLLTNEYLGYDFEDLVNPTGGGGGPSHCTSSTRDEPSTCSGGYAKPSWQTGTGVPADGKRDIPDVSLFAANWVFGPVNWGGSAILICQASNSPTKSCDYSNPDYIIYQEDGGTSASSPYMAGVMALVLQKTGTRQGLANPALYKLAAKDNLTDCNAGTFSGTGGETFTYGISPSCVFHDVTIGTNSAPCVTSAADPNSSCTTGGDTVGVLDGYAATAGYDRATGLGSINATNLVNDWTSVAPNPTLAVTPTSLTFASTEVGSAAAAQVVTVKNTGSVAATLYSHGISFTGTDASSFTETTTCPYSLAVGASCTISVVFRPAVAGALTASLSLADNATGSPQAVSLKGTGATAGGGAVTLSPTSVKFPNTVTATTSDDSVVTLKNSGTSTLTISAITLGGTNPTSFVELSSCAATLAAGASCSIYVAFDPTKAGALSATLSVRDSGSGSPQTVALSGTGTAAPSVKLSTTSITFAKTAHGTTSAAQAVTLTNSGTAILDLDSIELTGTNPTDFEAVNNCAATLAAGASCTVYLAFKPAAAATYKATLSIVDNGSASPQTVALTGTGD